MKVAEGSFLLTMGPGLPLVKLSFKSTVCYFRDLTVPAQIKDYLATTHTTLYSAHSSICS